MKQPPELNREQVGNVVRQIRDIRWRDPTTAQLDPERSSDVEAIEWVSGVLDDAGLKPHLDRPVSPMRDQPFGRRRDPRPCRG
jgi:hypothetical protein